MDPAGNIIFRDASPADATALSALLEVLGYPASAEQVHDRMTTFAADGRGTILVGTIGNEVVACAALLVYEPFHTIGRTVHVTALAVSVGHQRQGIGKRLIRHIESWAAQRGCRKIVVTSAEHRNGAHAFYPSVGWKYTGRRYGKTLDTE